MILTDSDGVLTDTGVYYSANGEELKRFSIRDGMGVERLRAAGIETAIITGEICLSVKRRAEKLKLRHFYPGIRDKGAYLATVLDQTGLRLDSLGYIGDDLNDFEVIGQINSAGLTAAPSDALPQISEVVHYRCGAAGGHGAFRDFAEWILALREPKPREQ